MSNTSEIPYGYCGCGCGEKTSIAKKKNTKHGHIKGEPIPFLKGHSNRSPAENRFWAKVQKTDDGCWLWIGGKDSSGYGTFHTGERTISAHRYSYELHIGPIPEGMLCCHHCDCPACCNPAHFFLGTKADNAHDRDKKGRNINHYGEKHGRAKLDEAKVMAIFVDFDNGMTKAKISRKYNIGYSQVSRVLSKEHWKHLWK